MKNFLRILLKALVHGAFLPITRDSTNVLATGEKAMPSNTASTKPRHGTFAPRSNHQLAPMPAPSSTDSAAANEEPSRSFIAVLLRCLSAFNA